MAFVMAIEGENVGEFVDEKRVEVRRRVLRMVLVCPGFFGLVVSASLCLMSGCVDGNGVRYWRLIDGSRWSIEEIKSPCGCKGFGGISYKLN